MIWYRSLYWRIAVGFIACLAVLLIVQGMLFVWMMATAGSTVPNQPPERFAQTVAIDVARAIERDPTLDVERYVRQEYATDAQPFLVVLTSGPTIEVGATFPEALKSEARARLNNLRQVDGGRFARGGFFGRGQGRVAEPREVPVPLPVLPGVPGAPGASPPGRGQEFGSSAGVDSRRQGRFGGDGPFGRGGGGLRPRPGLIVAGDRVVGLVLVPPQPPYTFLLRRYAPTLVTVAALTLIVGGVLAALVVFGPARRRLKEVEDAARRLGAGDLRARAPVSGNDEVTAVASAFNAMAHDLAARTEALVEADRARRQLLADVSHELNTPVTAMRGYIETLAMPELALDAATRAKYLAIVGDETARLERLIGELLDLARLEGGGGELRLERLRVQDLFDRVLARHERAAREAQVTLLASVGPGAGAIMADRTRLEQAVQNLAANALRYAPPQTSVRLEATRAGRLIVIRVSDEGPGVPPEHLPRVFDRFYKVDSSRTVPSGEPGGSGLGLSIVKAIVERHGAHIAVDSRPGRTVFTIEGLRAVDDREDEALAPGMDGDDRTHA